MTTFDLADVHRFTGEIGIRMDRTLGAALRHYAEICREFRDGLRGWGRAVFAGRVEYDPEVERVWLDEGRRLHARASDVYAHSRGSAASRDSLENLAALEAALGGLDRLLTEWVTPGPAIGPSAGRWRFPDQAATEDERRRIASLPPLPGDWEPDDPGQRARYREFRRPR
jgi:hypothetical protein